MPADTQAGRPQIDLSRYELKVNGQRVKLERQPMELLIFLVRRKGCLVTREDIIEKLWGKDVFVDVDGSINRAVRKIRVALKDDHNQPRYLETVVGKGYRFIGDLEAIVASAPLTASPSQIVGPEVPPIRAADGVRRTVAWGIILLLVAAGALSTWSRWRSASSTERTNIHSLAVLPLVNLSGDESQDYFAESMTDELITELAKVGALRVISRTSIVHYRGTTKSLAQIAKELRVDAVVEGTIVHSGDRLRITAQLIDANADRHLWAESYERDERDVLTLQKEVAGDITRRVNAALTPAEQSRLASRITVNSQAYDYYLRGLFFWNKWTEDGVHQAINHFQQAIQADPDYAPAYAGLANAYVEAGDFGVSILPPREANRAAEKAALQAIALDDSIAEAHAALALSRFRPDGDLLAAEREFKRAIEINPGSAIAHHWYSHYLLATGRAQEAITEGDRATDLSPIDPEMGVHMQFVFLTLHRYDDVIEQGRKTLELDPNFGETHWLNGQAYELKHINQEAGRELRIAVELSGRRSSCLAALAHFLAGSGDRQGALRILGELNKLSQRRFVSSDDKALIYIGLGDKERALEALEDAYKEGSYWMFTLQTDARWDPLRSDPRFQILVRRVGLPQE
jgi:TolB-like protein/DNA-binding winged helix-turn-helix (wHTH) protein/Tfp pilus assembly protein PilF